MAMILKVQKLEWRSDSSENPYPSLKTNKIIIVDDDYDYASQCDGNTNIVHIADIRDGLEVDDLRKGNEKEMDIDEAKKIYSEHVEDCECKICKRVKR